MGDPDIELELDKLRVVGPQLAATVAFIQWLHENGIVLAQPNPAIGMLSRLEATPDQVAAAFHGIDMVRLEKERKNFLGEK